MSDSANPEKKIIIDEDWKAQAQAKHFIDTVALILEKTQGNRTQEETEMIEEVLHQLRMGYVAVNKA